VRVHLLTASAETDSVSSFGSCVYRKLMECQREDRFKIHSVTNDPDEADLIIFAENDHGVGVLGTEVRAHPLVRKFRDKCFMYNASDTPLPFLPGIYSSIERRWYQPERVRSGHYLSSHITVPPLLSVETRDLLFSFVGAGNNASVRRRVLGLRHSRAFCEDTSAHAQTVWHHGKDAIDRFAHSYAQVLARTKFALCPRGVGASSMRVFESMRAGCVPVIISDAWVPPTGPDWSAFSIRVPEATVEAIPAILEAADSTSEAMGLRARRAWEDWFSDAVSFHRLVQWCIEILESRRMSERFNPVRLAVNVQLLRPLHLRRFVREARDRLLR
jgi:hypothetical protein